MPAAPLITRPARINLEFLKGATHYSQYNFLRGETPLDFTDLLGRMHVRHNVSDTETVLELTTENGGLTLGGSAGTLIMFLSASAAVAMDEVRDGVYDVELYEVDVTEGEIVTRVLEGKFEAVNEVTR